MNLALDVILKFWITIGPLVLLGTLFIYGIAQGKWHPFIWACVVFITGVFLLSGGNKGVVGTLIVKIADGYNVNKNTVELVKIVDSNLSIFGASILTVYFLFKFFIKILVYSFIMKIFEEKSGFWKNIFIGLALLIIVSIFGVLGQDSLVKKLILNEGYFSVILLAVIIVRLAIFQVGKKHEKKGGRSMLTVASAMVISVVAVACGLGLEAQLWRPLDRKVFDFILGS